MDKKEKPVPQAINSPFYVAAEAEALLRSGFTDADLNAFYKPCDDQA
jgi:hypothetical protein